MVVYDRERILRGVGGKRIIWISHKDERKC